MTSMTSIDYAELDACVRDLRQEMIDFTSELVAIASENPPGANYPACVQRYRIAAACARLAVRGGEVSRARAYYAVKPTNPAPPSSSAASARAKQTLYFSGHYDVVPVTTPGQCTPVLRGHTLFGRGSADMKSGLASMLYAAVALERLRVRLDGRVGLVFVPDEETGGARGSGFLAAAKRLGTNGIGMLTPEPTSGVVWNANRGAITMRVTVHGREAHVGLMHQGRNAFEDAIRVVQGLQRPRAPGRTPADALPRDAGNGAPLADADRRPRRGRLELQRRARPLRVHRGSADEPRKKTTKRSVRRCSPCSTRRGVMA